MLEKSNKLMEELRKAIEEELKSKIIARLEDYKEVANDKMKRARANDDSNDYQYHCGRYCSYNTAIDIIEKL